MPQIPRKIRPRLILFAACAFYAFVRLRDLDASCLWFDEIFSVHAARHQWADLLRFAAADIVHPPLFYLLLKIWIALGGESLFWLRLFPALASVAALAPFVALCRTLRLPAPAIYLAAWLMAVNAYLIKYAQTLRSYSLLMLLGLTSLWLFQRRANDVISSSPPREAPIRFDWALFVVNLLLVYTHYYGWMIVALEALYVSSAISRARGGDRPSRRLRQRWATFFALHAAGLVACFAPWAWAVADAAAGQPRGLDQNIGWAPRPTPREVATFFLTMHEIPGFRWNVVVASTLFLVPLALLLLKQIADRRRGRKNLSPADEFEANNLPQRTPVALPLLAAVCLPIAAAFALSRVLPQSIWGVRHLIFVAPLYFALIGLAFSSFLPRRPDWSRLAAAILLGCWVFGAGAASLLRRPDDFVWCAWEPLAARLAGGAPAAFASPARERIFVFEELIAYHIWFALKNAGVGERFQVISVKNFPELREDAAYFLPRRFDAVVVDGGGPDALTGDHFWVAFRGADAADWDERREPLRTLIGRGYAVGRRYSFGTPQGTAYLIEARRRE